MILQLNKHPQEAIAAIDAMENILTYGELVDFSNEIGTLIPSRSFTFFVDREQCGWCGLEYRMS